MKKLEERQGRLETTEEKMNPKGSVSTTSLVSHHGMYGSKGMSTRNSAGVKKNPAAMNGICVGCSSLP
jgi:hypothetical protein